MADLPTFRYHPDPLGTGAIQLSDAECRCCGRTRGYIYTGPVYAEKDLDDSLCPWCITDGSAAEKFDATFTDIDALCYAKLPQEVVEEVANRTPGFTAWQSEQWPSCCNDACAFLGDAQRSDLESMGKTAHEVLVAGWNLTEDDFADMVENFQSGSSPAVYKFQCLHCHKNHFYADVD
jgi:uncharacterized protein CbrC (UPF0167 family)